ncbi:MAG TPA: hypothetical protein DER10_07490 [Elusimicrobia bacterium]|nr:hypothetical protein [Elusimicrobiota bacterium]HCE98324.1 hypothetical protein [Elusimicrobiota bacterium]
MASVYVLYSEALDKFYTGSTRTENANTRLVAHNHGKTRFTKAGRPWKLVYEENCRNYTEARRRENFLKSGAGRKWVFARQTIRRVRLRRKKFGHCALGAARISNDLGKDGRVV